jgi:hypothetical protein
MPIDLGKKQTIEEITNGRIKKKAKEEGAPARGGRTAERGAPAARKGGRAAR